MAYLRIVRDGQLEGQVELTGTIVRIGRDASNDVVLEDPTKWVSRAHAEIRVQGSTYTIVDLGTPNGIRVNRQQAAQAILSSGTSIEIGPYQLQFVADNPAPVAAGDATVLSPGKGARAAAPPVSGRAKVPPVVVPRQPMGKTARQALTFVGIVIVVAVVAVIDAQRPMPKPPVPVDPGPVMPSTTSATQDTTVGQSEQASASTPIQTVTDAHPTSGSTRPRPSWQDDEIPQMAGESNSDWEARTGLIKQLWSSAQQAVRNGLDPSSHLNELHTRQTKGYKQSRDLERDYAAGLEALRKAHAEDKRLETALGFVAEARRLWGSGFESAITTAQTDIEAKLARLAEDRYKSVQGAFAQARRNPEALKKAIDGLTQVCDLLPAKHPLRQQAEIDLAQIR